MTLWTVLFGIGLSAMLLSYTGIIYLRRWALRRMLDVPNNRSSHTMPTPRGGGLAIVICTLSGLWIVTLVLQPALPLAIVVSYSMSAILIAGVSWLDDLRSLSNRLRFGVHILGALLVITSVGFFERVQLPFLLPLTIGWAGFLIALLWVIGLTNAYNFMDGIDGLAGEQAVVAGFSWAVFGYLAALPVVSIVGVLIAGSSLGFLGHNWPPARIFMGDVGSAFLGFTLATLAVVGGLTDPRLPLAGLLVVWPFVFDATFTFLRRLRRGENIFTAHRSHLYQRLVILGYSHRAVTLLYLFLAVIGALVALSWFRDSVGSPFLAIFIPATFALGLWLFVVLSEKRDEPKISLE